MNCCKLLWTRTAAALAMLLFALSSADAGEGLRLTRDGRFKRDPRFVQGGSFVVYSVAESPIMMRLMRLDLATGETEPLYPQAATSQFESSFSPDDRFHVFVEFR